MMADWEGRTVLDRAGEKIGTIEEIFEVEETGQPEWALVKVGRLRGRTTLVPLARAHAVDDGVELDVDKDVVSEAPAIDSADEPQRAAGQRPVSPLRHRPRRRPRRVGERQRSPCRGGHGRTGDARPADLRPRQAGLAGRLDAPPPGADTGQGRDGRQAKQVGLGAGMFGGAGYVAHLASIALMLCIIFALAEAMPAWLAALIVTVLYAAVAAGLALTARKRIQNAGPPIPEQTVESVKQTIETDRRQEGGSDGDG